ncbi:hypothetical protein [Streptomyces syringium]|uniref:hypothetical protein n=1 Tax=Streptomyces syringium TaxID=76729 RepID=UPI00343EA26F
MRGASEPVQQRGRTVVLLELAGRVRAVALDADTGRLEFVPNAPGLRQEAALECAEVIAAATERVRARTSAPCTSWRPRP